MSDKAVDSQTSIRSRLAELIATWRTKTPGYSIWDDAADEAAALLASWAGSNSDVGGLLPAPAETPEKRLAEWMEHYYGAALVEVGCPCDKSRGVVCPLHAALSLPAPAETRTRFAWLMERCLVRDEEAMRRTPAGTLVYWDGGHAQSFTTDPYKAVQWPTKDAAMQQCPPEHYAQWGWSYVEHGFMALPAQAPRGSHEFVGGYEIDPSNPAVCQVCGKRHEQ